jgi:tRNA (guanine-N7-)-methyltransferase
VSRRSEPREEEDGRLRSFGRRRTKHLGTTRKALLEALLPHVRIAVPEQGMLRLEALFPAPMREFWLEIGFGSGEHLAEQAKRHPLVGMIGCEPFVDGVAKLLEYMETMRLEHIRIHDDDARILLDRLPDASLARVFLLFPDPWPKTRHHKRRLVNSALLTSLARVMRPGGTLCIATDHEEYAEWILLHLLNEDIFSWLAVQPDDFRLSPPWWVETRYQEKAAAAGRAPLFLTFERAR